jgi:hypothetical protein
MTIEELPPASDDEREALEFLGKGRRLRGLSPAQFRRIEGRLAGAHRPHRCRSLLPVLAAATVALLAGAAVAHVVDFSRLPLVGSLFPSRPSQSVLKPHRPHRAPAVAPPGSADPSSTTAATPTPSGVGTPVVEPAPAVKRMPAVERIPVEGRALVRERAPVRERIPVEGRTPVRERTLAMHSTERLQAAPLSGPLPTVAPPATPSDTEAGRGLRLESPGRAGSAVAQERVAVREDFLPPRAAAPRTPAARAPSPAEDPISAESRSFSAALGQWHRDHNAEAALAALDRHERRFPYGQIRLEAKLLRAEILLQQGREREALGLLDGVSLSGLPRGRELQTVRGELRVKYGRCREGRSDLEHVLAKDRADALGHRAARAIALCP